MKNTKARLEEKAKEKLINEGAKPLGEFAGYLFKDDFEKGIRNIYAPTGDGSYYLRSKISL